MVERRLRHYIFERRAGGRHELAGEKDDAYQNQAHGRFTVAAMSALALLALQALPNPRQPSRRDAIMATACGTVTRGRLTVRYDKTSSHLRRRDRRIPTRQLVLNTFQDKTIPTCTGADARRRSARRLNSAAPSDVAGPWSSLRCTAATGCALGFCGCCLLRRAARGRDCVGLIGRSSGRSSSRSSALTSAWAGRSGRYARCSCFQRSSPIPAVPTRADLRQLKR